jgi:hypothetical protein
LKTKELDYSIPLIIPYNGIIEANNENERFNIFKLMCEKLNDSFLEELENNDFEIENVPKNFLGDSILLSFEGEENKTAIFAMSLYSLKVECIEGKPKRRDLQKVIAATEDYFVHKYYDLYVKINDNQKSVLENKNLEDEIDKIMSEIKTVFIAYHVGHKDKKRVFQITANLYHTSYEDTLVNIAQQEVKEEHTVFH